MRRVRLVAGGWSSEAEQAVTFIERFRGLRSLGPDARLLIRARSVHTIGMSRPIGVLVIAHDGAVLDARTLSRNRVLFHNRARHILEVPEGSDLPPLESRVEINDV
jgi:hypothetical protein